MADATYAPKIYRKDGGDTMVIASGGVVLNQANTLRTRVATADCNTGVTLLAALPGKKYRLLDAYAIAYGGAAGACTSVDINGTSTTAKVLVAFAQGNLTQSALLRAGATGATILADGASFLPMDANTAITFKTVGSAMTTATGIDVTITYVVEE